MPNSRHIGRRLRVQRHEVVGGVEAREESLEEVFNCTNRPALVINTVFSTFSSLLGNGVFVSYGSLLLQSSGLMLPNDSYIVTFVVSFAILVVTSIQPLILSRLE
ncbi:unnamed protein product [Linum trigynum]|uniref:Uncharacterized protein n=1 Tax=Linum trigynum TaxID=586398 RepID=A0AAV2FKZ3_9ROSI